MTLSNILNFVKQGHKQTYSDMSITVFILVLMDLK